MSSITVGVGAAPYVPPSSSATPVAAHAATTVDGAEKSDPFGPATIVTTSPEAQNAHRTIGAYASRRLSYDETIASIDWDGFSARLRSRGMSEEKIQIETDSFKGAIKELKARGDAAEESMRQQALARQTDVETALVERNNGAPQELIDAVRGMNAVRNNVGAGRAYETDSSNESFKTWVRDRFGEDTLQRILANAKKYDETVSYSAGLEASRLARRFGVSGTPIVTDANGKKQVGSFALSGISGGYAVKFDAQSQAISVFREGVDITAAILRGGAFGKGGGPVSA